MKADFDMEFDQVIERRPVLFADFWGRTADSRIYEEITDHKRVGNFLLRRAYVKILVEYAETS